LDILIDQRLAIALIHYAPLVNAHITQITSFLGAHFVVVVGIDIKSICINDPLSTGSGAGLEVPIDVFKQAWSQCSLDNNPINGAIVTTIPIQDLSTSDTPTNGVEYEIGLWGGKQILGINVRSGPSSTYSLVNTIWQAETPDIYITQISGDWGQLADGSGWVYMPYLVKAGS
jgi:hypothetical protein